MAVSTLQFMNSYSAGVKNQHLKLTAGFCLYKEVNKQHYTNCSVWYSSQLKPICAFEKCHFLFIVTASCSTKVITDVFLAYFP